MQQPFEGLAMPISKLIRSLRQSTDQDFMDTDQTGVKHILVGSADLMRVSEDLSTDQSR